MFCRVLSLRLLLLPRWSYFIRIHVVSGRLFLYDVDRTSSKCILDGRAEFCGARAIFKIG